MNQHKKNEYKKAIITFGDDVLGLICVTISKTNNAYINALNMLKTFFPVKPQNN